MHGIPFRDKKIGHFFYDYLLSNEIDDLFWMRAWPVHARKSRGSLKLKCTSGHHEMERNNEVVLEVLKKQRMIKKINFIGRWHLDLEIVKTC